MKMFRRTGLQVEGGDGLVFAVLVLDLAAKRAQSAAKTLQHHGPDETPTASWITIRTSHDAHVAQMGLLLFCVEPRRLFPRQNLS